MSLLESVQNASHSVIVVVYRFFRPNHRSESDSEAVAAYRDDMNAWEQLSDEALVNFEKRFE
jgi:hypothetical protein